MTTKVQGGRDVFGLSPADRAAVSRTSCCGQMCWSAGQARFYRASWWWLVCDRIRSQLLWSAGLANCGWPGIIDIIVALQSQTNAYCSRYYLVHSAPLQHRTDASFGII